MIKVKTQMTVGMAYPTATSLRYLDLLWWVNFILKKALRSI